MSQVVWKYPLLLGEPTVLDMPRGARVLCVQVQHGIPCLWAMVTPGPVERRAFVIVGTGYPIDLDYALPYIGTFQLYDGGFVGHLFELPLRDAGVEVPAGAVLDRPPCRAPLGRASP